MPYFRTRNGRSGMWRGPQGDLVCFSPGASTAVTEETAQVFRDVRGLIEVDEFGDPVPERPKARPHGITRATLGLVAPPEPEKVVDPEASSMTADEQAAFAAAQERAAGTEAVLQRAGDAVVDEISDETEDAAPDGEDGPLDGLVDLSSPTWEGGEVVDPRQATITQSPDEVLARDDEDREQPTEGS